MALTQVVPFLLEDKLKERGGIYSKARPFAPYVQIDGKLVTGQNPASSRPAAQALLQLLYAGGNRQRQDNACTFSPTG